MVAGKCLTVTQHDREGRETSRGLLHPHAEGQLKATVDTMNNATWARPTLQQGKVCGGPRQGTRKPDRSFGSTR